MPATGATSGHPSLFPSNLVTLALSRWGRMDPARWTAFVDWLFAHDLISDRNGQILPRSAVDVASLFTNELLP